MLSYQHIYHAGNPADIHKHLVLLLLLRRQSRKLGRLQYLETHAGRGIYDLTAPEARKTAEFETGIGRLIDRRDGGPALQDLLTLVRDVNARGHLRRYPGSPAIAAAALGPQDRLFLCELHPREREYLDGAMPFHDKRISILAEDGWQRLESLQPPAAGGTVLLIDPSWELKDEYWTVPGRAAQALRRLGPAATALVWYPLLADSRHEALLEGVEQLSDITALSSILHFPPAREGERPGMRGSGLIVLNPPTGLAGALTPALEPLPKLLFDRPGARHALDWLARSRA